MQLAQPTPRSAPSAEAPTSAPITPPLVRALPLRGLPGARSSGTAPWAIGDPPRPGSLTATADMAFVRGVQRLRSAAGDDWARELAATGATTAWVDLARRHADTSGAPQAWLGAALLAASMAGTAATTLVLKHRHDRQRPYQVDPRIVPPVPLPSSASFPSGHSSSAYAAARVIARLAPSLAREAYELARGVALSRVYAGVHFPTDVVAGANLGTWVADRVLVGAGRGAAAQAARLELVAATTTATPVDGPA